MHSAARVPTRSTTASWQSRPRRGLSLGSVLSHAKVQQVTLVALLFLQHVSWGPGLVSSQQFNSAGTAQVTLIEFEYGGAITYKIPSTEFYGPQHDVDLCIHPAVNPLDFDFSNDQLRRQPEDVWKNPFNAYALRVASLAGDQCVVHQEDAINVCSLMGPSKCAAMTCLPDKNFLDLDPPQRRTDSGKLIGALPVTVKLLAAAEEGNLNQVRQALVDGADVDAVDGVHGKSSLMYAARRGDVLMVKALLASGASTELQDNQGLVAQDHNVEYLEHLHVKMNHEQQVPIVNHADVKELLEKHAFSRALEKDRLNQEPGTEVRNSLHENMLLRSVVSARGNVAAERAKKAALYLEHGIAGPVCLLRAHATVNEPRSELCSADPSSPKPRCTNIKLTTLGLTELARTEKLPTHAARRLYPGLKAGRKIFAFPPYVSDELWFQHWAQGEDIIGEVPVRTNNTNSKTMVLLVFAPSDEELYTRPAWRFNDELFKQSWDYRYPYEGQMPHTYTPQDNGGHTGTTKWRKYEADLNRDHAS